MTPSRALAAACLLALAALQAAAQEGPRQENPREPEAGSLTGQLLVATQSIRDQRFARTVIFMVRHDKTGAFGLIVNRPVGESPLAALLEGLGLEGERATGTIRVHFGGPVEGRRGFVLHTLDWTGPGTVNVDGAIGMTGSPEIFRALAAGRGPKRHLFALGYAGWAPGQLDGELSRGGWISAPSDETLVFDDDHATKWQRATDKQIIRL